MAIHVTPFTTEEGTRSRMRETWAATDHHPGWDDVVSTDPRLRAIQNLIASWARTGARPDVVPLVLDDIATVLRG